MDNPFLVICNKVDELTEKVERVLQSNLNEQGVDKTEFMRIEEVALYMGLKESTIYTYTRERKLKHYKRGGILFFKKSEVNDFINAGLVEPKRHLRK